MGGGGGGGGGRKRERAHNVNCKGHKNHTLIMHQLQTAHCTFVTTKHITHNEQ